MFLDDLGFIFSFMIFMSTDNTHNFGYFFYPANPAASHSVKPRQGAMEAERERSLYL